MQALGTVTFHKNEIVEMLRNQHFITYPKVLQTCLQGLKGNVFVNASNVLKCRENNFLVQEFMHLCPDIFEAECSYKVRKNKNETSHSTTIYII